MIIWIFRILSHHIANSNNLDISTENSDIIYIKHNFIFRVYP